MIKEDEGFYFGLGAFETIAVEDQIPQFFCQHMERLQKTLQYFQLPVQIKKVENQAEQFLQKEVFRQGRKVLKIAVSEKNIVCSVRENPYQEKDYLCGFTAEFSAVRRNETSPLTYHKTLNYGDCILEKRRAVRENFQEAVFLNTRGEIAEGTCSNVFFWSQGHIIAPPLSCGMLPGIIRQYIYEHYPVIEKNIKPEQVSDYEEMFLTNSLFGIMPVKKLGGHTFSSMKAGRALAEKFYQGSRP